MEYDDPKKIKKQSFQWKMSFNLDPSPINQAQEVIFSLKNKKTARSVLSFKQ